MDNGAAPCYKSRVCSYQSTKWDCLCNTLEQVAAARQRGRSLSDPISDMMLPAKGRQQLRSSMPRKGFKINGLAVSCLAVHLQIHGFGSSSSKLGTSLYGLVRSGLTLLPTQDPLQLVDIIPT